MEATTADFDPRGRYVEALEDRLSKVESLLKKVPYNSSIFVLSFQAHWCFSYNRMVRLRRGLTVNILKTHRGHSGVPTSQHSLIQIGRRSRCSVHEVFILTQQQTLMRWTRARTRRNSA